MFVTGCVGDGGGMYISDAFGLFSKGTTMHLALV